jgi:hypothetical protein
VNADMQGPRCYARVPAPFPRPRRLDGWCQVTELPVLKPKNKERLFRPASPSAVTDGATALRHNMRRIETRRTSEMCAGRSQNLGLVMPQHRVHRFFPRRCAVAPLFEKPPTFASFPINFVQPDEHAQQHPGWQE